MAQLSVVIPTRGRPGSLARVLDALARQADPPRELQVVVASDESDEAAATAAAIERAALPVDHVVADSPGAAGAREAGWRTAGAATVLFLDDDVIPSSRLVAEHLSWHARAPGADQAVLGLVRWAPELRVTPFMRWLERGIQFDYESIEGDRAQWWHLYTANVSIPRRRLERAGGFDPAFPFHYEDLDLGRRLSRLGIEIRFNRAAVGYHLHAVTLDGYRARIAGIAAAERRFVERYPEAAAHFHRRFRAAADRPRVRGTTGRLIGVIPRGTPWLGTRAWTSADRYFSQELAPDFLAAWDAAGDERAPTAR